MKSKLLNSDMAFSPTKQASKLEEPRGEETKPKGIKGKKFCLSHTSAFKENLLKYCGNPQCVANNIQHKMQENSNLGFLIYFYHRTY